MYLITELPKLTELKGEIEMLEAIEDFNMQYLIERK
jgi:hypothetical protein